MGQIRVNYGLFEDQALENSGKYFGNDEIWNALKTKYGTNDYGTKKYACIHWLAIKMIDN